MKQKPDLDLLKSLGGLAAMFLIPAFLFCSFLDIDPIDYALHHNDPGYHEQNIEGSSSSNSSSSTSNSTASKSVTSPSNPDLPPDLSDQPWYTGSFECEPYSPSKDTGKSGSDSAQGYIKGNISADGEKIYHMPGDKYYDVTVIDTSKGERWFSSPEEAEAAGWRRAYV